MHRLLTQTKWCPVCGDPMKRVPTDGSTIVHRCTSCRAEVAKAPRATTSGVTYRVMSAGADGRIRDIRRPPFSRRNRPSHIIAQTENVFLPQRIMPQTEPVRVCLVTAIFLWQRPFKKSGWGNTNDGQSEGRPAAPFNITRSSHVYLNVRDLAKSRIFTRRIGLVVSGEENGTVYLRGSRRRATTVWSSRLPIAHVECVGMRVASAAELDLAEKYFAGSGVSVRRIERPYQGETMLMTFDRRARRSSFVPACRCCRACWPISAQKGGRALRLDHYQCVVPDVDATAGAASWRWASGHRNSRRRGYGKIVSIFLHRKNNPHDIVLAQGGGPRCTTSPLSSAIFRTCCVPAIPRLLRYGRDVEHGIGRHGPPNGVFAYFRDPDAIASS